MSTSDLLLLGLVLFILIDFSAGMVINYLNERSKNPVRIQGRWARPTQPIKINCPFFWLSAPWFTEELRRVGA